MNYSKLITVKMTWPMHLKKFFHFLVKKTYGTVSNVCMLRSKKFPQTETRVLKFIGG